MNETSNHDDSTVRTVTAGKNDREWEVEILDDEYIVHYPQKDKSQIVTLGNDHCTGTYFEYNETCPHIKAARKAKRRKEDEKIGRHDYVDCPLCGKVHSGSCQEISTHTPM